MPSTTNFNWTTPADTDLVKDGAAAIRTLGNGIDTSFVDLKGGTTGQVLSKASNTDLDYSWITVSSGAYTQLATGTLSGSSVTLSSISGTYKDLILVFNGARFSTDGGELYARFNGDTGNNYFTTVSAAPQNQAFGVAEVTLQGPTDSATSNAFSRVDIYDYANSSTWKLGRVTNITPNETTTTNYNLYRGAFGWGSTSAITSITLLRNVGTFNGGTYFLYGVK